MKNTPALINGPPAPRSAPPPTIGPAAGVRLCGAGPVPGPARPRAPVCGRQGRRRRRGRGRCGAAGANPARGRSVRVRGRGRDRAGQGGASAPARPPPRLWAGTGRAPKAPGRAAPGCPLRSLSPTERPCGWTRRAPTPRPVVMGRGEENGRACVYRPTGPLQKPREGPLRPGSTRG